MKQLSKPRGRQPAAPGGRTIDTRTRKAARAAVVLAALVWVFAVWLVRLTLGTLAIGGILGIAAGIYAQSAGPLIVSALVLAAISRVPRRELRRSFFVFVGAAILILKITYVIFSAAMCFFVVIALGQGSGDLLLVAAFGLIPMGLHLLIRHLGRPDPFHDVHLAGTSIIGETEAIDRANRIRFPNGR